MGIHIQILIALLMIISTPFLSFPAELIHTIQIGSHQLEHRAQRQYGAVLDVLKEEDRAYLRIEQIGGYYALRIGKFTSFEDVAGLLGKVAAVYPGARTMTAYISNNRLVEMYQPAEVKAPVPEPIGLPVELAIASESAKVAAAPVPTEIEEPVPAALELTAEPERAPAETTAQPEQVDVAAPALDSFVAQLEQVASVPPAEKMLPVVAEESAVAVLVPQAEPVVLQELETIVVLQAEVETSPAEPPVEVAAQTAVVDVVSPAAAVGEVDKVGTESVAATVASVEDSRSLIIVVAAVILVVLIFSVRALRGGKTAPQKSEASSEGGIAETAVASKAHSAENDETEAAFDSEAQNLYEAEMPLPQHNVAAIEAVAEQEVATIQVGDDRFVATEVESSVETAVESSEEQNESLVSIMRGLRGVTTSGVERSVEKIEPAETALVALPVAECAEKKEEIPVKEERQNRVSRAMEAAMLGRNNGK